ncbi:sideroflexin-2 isoform X2 [Strix aluco]|uniref:sideroflexin-2 isoform X2 n=1 Tax=Strix aluco TaxID=111821 RepID=UPI003DA4F601
MAHFTLSSALPGAPVMINTATSSVAAALAPWTITVTETKDQMCPQARLLQRPQPMPTAPCISLLKWLLWGTVPAVVFWQWVNQSFNAIVNYTNRNAASPISLRQIGVAYITATGTALATAVGLNLYTKRAPPLLARWVPFAAVAAANCVNIPMMRQQEIINGVTVTDGDNNELGCSRRAAAKGIAQVVVSRITMAAPGMIILPIIMERLEKFPFMQRIRVLHGPLQVLLCGGFLLFMVPAACALFPQRCSLALADLELELRDSIVAKYGDKVPYVYFNKGL